MGKSLRADIIIGGKADNSFYRLGNALETLGSQINVVSSRLIEYGKESVEAYTSYEDYMLDAEVALRTQYQSTSELGKVMDQLDKSALQWARDSRFTTEDVAGAIDNAAHAGWNLEQILNGVPSAMKASLAGGMELSDGLEYLVDISNAAGIGFEDLGDLVDYWTFAANRSSTKIPEMGQAMQKMGATMQFVKGDMAGLTTMLAVLANNGAKGTEAGTLLRNSLIRLIAPTQKAAEAIDGLDLSMDDLSEIYSNPEAVEQATEMLDAAGFSAYDAAGNLKSFLTIFQELNAATSGMSEQDRNTILSAIFPTRTITGALALLEAAANDWDGLYDSIRNGSDGYADYAAQKMESGLGGTLRHLESVYNTLQTRTGKELSGDVSFVTNALSGLIENLNGMDDRSFGALVSGLEAVAVAGPSLMVAGGAIKLIGAIVGTGPVGKIVLLGTALAAVAAAANSLHEAAYEDKFGNLNVDTDKISEYLSGIGNAFDEAQSKITQYGEAMETALTDYETASASLKESMITSMLTSSTLTESDKKKLYSLGDQMRESLLAGIEGSYSKSESTVALFADEDAIRLADDEDSVWSGIIDTLNYGYGQAIAQAEKLSSDLRSAMTSAFSDGVLTSDEISNIQSFIDQQNKMMAMYTDAQNAADRERMLQKAQTVGLDGVNEISDLVTEQRDSELASLEEEYWQAYKNIVFAGNVKIDNGYIKEDGTPYTQADIDRELAILYYGDPNDPTDGYLGKKLAKESDFDKMLLGVYDNNADGSTLGGVWNGLEKMADQYLATGVLTETALNAYKSSFTVKDRDDISKYIADVVDILGGESEMRARADYYSQIGDQDSANAFARLIAMYNLSDTNLSGIAPTEQTVPYSSNAYTIDKAREQNKALSLQDEMTDLAWQYMEDALRSGNAVDFKSIMSGNYTDTGYQSGINSIIEQLRGVYDLSSVPVTKGLESIRDYAAAYRLMFDETINAEDYRIQVIPEIDETAMEKLGDTTIPVNGDTSNLSAAIDAEGGKTLVENVDGDTSALAAAIAQYNGKAITIAASIGLSPGLKKYADGGRASEASIFGEAGPEWAIPEEHTQRTADLLNAARAASGFTWPELLSRNGGLNAGSKGSWSLVYRPTIVAADVTGVEQKLKEDKTRLEKCLRDLQLHDDVEVYS